MNKFIYAGYAATLAISAQGTFFTEKELVTPHGLHHYSRN